MMMLVYMVFILFTDLFLVNVSVNYVVYLVYLENRSGNALLFMVY